MNDDGDKYRHRLLGFDLVTGGFNELVKHSGTSRLGLSKKMVSL
jgi:hypothetical protein